MHFPLGQAEIGSNSADLRKLYRDLGRALTEESPATLGALFREDFEGVALDGSRYAKSQCIKDAETEIAAVKFLNVDFRFEKISFDKAQREAQIYVTRIFSGSYRDRPDTFQTESFSFDVVSRGQSGWTIVRHELVQSTVYINGERVIADTATKIVTGEAVHALRQYCNDPY